MDIETARTTLLLEYSCEEYDHFGKPAYRLGPKKHGGKPGRTFVTLWIEEGFAVLMLNLDQQTVLVEEHSGKFEPHPSKWGQKGATVMHLDKTDKALFAKAVSLAYEQAKS